jgi:hypothetical protein
VQAFRSALLGGGAHKIYCWVGRDRVLGAGEMRGCCMIWGSVRREFSPSVGILVLGWVEGCLCRS